jgi:hypothetical protein
MVVAALLLSVAGCTSGSSTDEAPAMSLPRPQLVIIETFAVSPDEVELDRGLSTQIEETVEASRGTSRTAQESAAGRSVADALAEKLVTEVQDLGFTARRGSGPPPAPLPALLITGQFVSVDEGNRTERVVIGLGAGRSDVRVRSQVFEVSADGQRLVEEIEVDARSGLQPGMAESMGVGAVAGRLVTATVVSAGLQVASESLGADVVADSDRAAKGIAKQLANFAGQQGWNR